MGRKDILGSGSCNRTITAIMRPAVRRFKHSVKRIGRGAVQNLAAIRKVAVSNSKARAVSSQGKTGKKLSLLRAPRYKPFSRIEFFSARAKLFRCAKGKRALEFPQSESHLAVSLPPRADAFSQTLEGRHQCALP